MTLRSRTVVVLLVLVLVGACASGRVGSSVVPTHWCTPLPTPNLPPGSPVPCSGQQARENQQQLAIETEAIAVYERFINEAYRIEFEGGAMEPSSILQETATGDFLEVVMVLLKYYKEQGLIARGEWPTVKVAVARDSEPMPGAVVTLITCEDTTKSFLYYLDGTLHSEGKIRVTNAFIGRYDGRLKVFSNDLLEGVSSCPFA